ncbi:MAG: HNH endonuclease [Smithella sp.]
MNPNELRTTLLVRAGYRCEYCKRRLGGERFEQEHIIPISLDGADHVGNLAVACRRCNGNKGTQVEAPDPFSWQTVQLFNPRLMKWEQHFRVLADEVFGITPIGRATAKVVFRTTPSIVAPDLAWKTLEGLANHEPLYNFLNDLRFMRIQNRFSDLLVELNRPLPDEGAEQDQIRRAQAARDFLALELLFTRARTEDIECGIKLGERLLAQTHNTCKRDIKCSLSILYQQRATVRFTEGRSLEAYHDQSCAHNLFIEGNGETLAPFFRARSAGDLASSLRAFTVEHKFSSVAIGQQSIRDVLWLATDLKEYGDPRYFSYLADLMLLMPPPATSHYEKARSLLEAFLEIGGYATGFDHARTITIRRRWWLLRFLLQENFSLACLRKDLDFWRSVEMFNEIRELRLGILRLSRQKPLLRMREIGEALTSFAGQALT